MGNASTVWIVDARVEEQQVGKLQKTEECATGVIEGVTDRKNHLAVG